LGFHVLLAALILFTAQLPSCRKDMAGDGGESFREAGIRLVPGTDPNDSGAGTGSIGGTPTGPEPSMSAVPAESEWDQPPVPLNLPSTRNFPPIIGPGSAASAADATADDLIRPAAAIGRPGGTGGGGQG